MIDQVIRDHKPAVVRLAASLLYTPDRLEDAEEAFSRALEVAYTRYAGRLEGSGACEGDFISYLYGCTRHVVMAMNSTHSRRTRLIEEHRQDVIRNLHGRAAARRDIEDPVGTVLEFIGKRLSERERRIIELYYRDGYRFDEIAEKLGLGHANVRKIHQRTLAGIREMIAGIWGPDGPDGSGGGAGIDSISRARKKTSGLSKRKRKSTADTDRCRSRLDHQTICIIAAYGRSCSICDEGMFVPSADDQKNRMVSALTVYLYLFFQGPDPENICSHN